MCFFIMNKKKNISFMVNKEFALSVAVESKSPHSYIIC
jgi:hypothetical protein